MMKAEIQELDGKYYGTRISVTVDGKGQGGSLELWRTIPGYTPSEQELQRNGITLEEYQNNDIVGEYPAGVLSEEAEPMRAKEYFCDEHFESAPDYKLAQYLRDAINAVEVCQHCDQFYDDRLSHCDCLQDIEEEGR